MNYFFTNIANMLTILRILLAPIFFLLFLSKLYTFSFIVFFIASITDIFDGYFARRYRAISEFGSIYDPLADKILVFFAFICIFIYPPFILSAPPLDVWRFFLLYCPIIIIVSRDFLITILRVKLKNKKIILKAGFFGKMKTIFQLIFIHIYLFEFMLIGLNLEYNFGIVKVTILVPMICGILFLMFEFLILLFSIISALIYLFKVRKILF